MNKALTIVPIAPLRKEAADPSEMVSQLLFGETLDVLEEKGNWIYVRCHYDQYEGWMDPKQIMRLTDKKFEQYCQQQLTLSGEYAHPCSQGDSSLMIVAGSNLNGYDGMSAKIDRRKYFYNGQVIVPDPERNIYFIKKFALKYLNAPYLWGGRSPFGIDCSGLTQMVFKFVGIALHRDASQQVLQGKPVNMLAEARLGDLAFFGDKPNKITHVGILLEEEKIVHAHGHVRIDTLDHHGILNSETKKYTHILRTIKRMT